MNLSLNWLKDFVDIPKSTTPEELAALLTLRTVEVDNIEKQVEKFNNVIIGKVLEINKHPNADRLNLAKVDAGKEVLDIVCGAPNLAAGQKVPVALVGAILPNGMEIKEAVVRGEKSCGMICAEDELGIGMNHAGILVLDETAKVGENLADFLKLNDIVFEVDNKALTNRPDLWNHMGMAREMAAFLEVKFKPLTSKIKQKDIEGIKEIVKVKVENADLCPRYMAIAMSGIKIAPSPEWMQKRLIAAGMRPLNNIVDITNYVMLEVGQPLHAFDKRLVSEIKVRTAKKGETMETLDGKPRELEEGILVIADHSKPIAVAGVMGGANSEISDDTTDIIIESANFNYVSIRKTSQKLNLRTESSIRYEKALDPNLCELAISRTVELVKKLIPDAKIASQLVDEKKFTVNQGPVEFNIKMFDKIIGIEMDAKKILDILDRLGFVVEKNEDQLKVTIPTWRANKDISIKEDIIEEAIRIYGYEKIEAKMPDIKQNLPVVNEERKLERKIKNILIGAPALSEVYNYSFVGEDQLRKLGIDFANYIRLANPIAVQHTMLRQTLIPNLLNCIRVNQARYDNFGLFEVGSIYLNNDGEIKKDDKGEYLPYQEKKIAMLLAQEKEENIYLKIKGVIEYLFNRLNLEINYSFLENSPYWAEAKYSTRVISDGRDIGMIFKLNKQVAKSTGVKKEVAVVELSLKEILDLSLKHSTKKLQEFEKYPPVIRDLAFVVNEKVLYDDIRKEIMVFSFFIKSAELFDFYTGEKIGKGNKNLAFHIIYQADKTFAATEIDELQTGLIKKMEEKFEAKVRDF
jgi:phenylalanyl-tRNA synthetase beta chain